MDPIAGDDAATQAPCVRSRFLHVLLDDEEHGRLHPVDHYLQTFAGIADFVRSEYEALLTSPRGDAVAAGVPATVGRYRITGELGAGGMGAVYTAIDPELGRRVVLKTLHPGMVRDAKAQERLRREARVLGALDHPNLATITDVVEAENCLHLVMPFHEGRTLGAYITAARSETDGTGQPSFVRLAGAADRAAALRQLLQCCAAAALALHKAHEAGVVHRDIKPENLLVRPDGSPVVLDFGLALPDEASRLTSVGEVLGTPLYMAPEQIEGAAATPRTDVYALGVVLYEALTLVHPFAGGGGRAATFQRILAGDPVPLRRHLPRVSRDLEAVVLRAMERNAARRYPTAAAMAKDLQRVCDLEPTEARPLSGMTVTWRRVRRQPKVALLSVLLSVSMLVIAWQQLSHAAHVAEAPARAMQLGVPEEVANQLRGVSRPSGMRLIAVAAVGPAQAAQAPDCIQWSCVVTVGQGQPRVLRHRVRVKLFDGAAKSLWTSEPFEFVQESTTTTCTVEVPQEQRRSAGSWSVTFTEWMDADGAWHPTDPDDPANTITAEFGK